MATTNRIQIVDSPASAADRWMPAGWAAALEGATRQVQIQLGGPETLAQGAFILGDGLQRSVVDSVFDLLSPRSWTPSGLLRMSTQVARQSRQAARFLIPGETSHLSWLELQNKIEIFLLVRNLPSTLQLPSDALLPLPELVKRAYAVSPFAAVWLVEGLGHYYADTYWKLKGVPKGLLSDAQVPAESLLMLHAGLGLSFAPRFLDNLIASSPDSQVRATIEQFVALCQENSKAGYMGAAIESLGLVTRDFYPELVPSVSRQLQQINPDLVGFFWHGAGRALYFSTTYFLPLLRTPWSAIDSESSDPMAQLGLMAGLAWALTVVNMRRPQIMENVLRNDIAQSRWKAGFTNGVSSSIIMRQDTTPDAGFISAFCAHRPSASDPNLLALWNQLIAAPCEEARLAWPRLRENHLLDQVFKFGPISGNSGNHENRFGAS